MVSKAHQPPHRQAPHPLPRAAQGARISEEDRSLWDALTRQALPLRRPALPRPSEAARPSVNDVVARSSDPGGAWTLDMPARTLPASPTVSPPAAPSRLPVLVVGERAPGLDNPGWASLTRTRLTVRRRTLDLHGRTVQAAYLALHDFLDRAHRDGVRHVEIITGRGSGPHNSGAATGSGAIRRELPHWLNAPALRSLLLGAAHPHPRNPGSVRLLLRRHKPSGEKERQR